MYVARIEGERRVGVYRADTGSWVCTIHTSYPVVGVDVQGDQVAVRVRDSSGRERVDVYRVKVGSCSWIRTIG